MKMKRKKKVASTIATIGLLYDSFDRICPKGKSQYCRDHEITPNMKVKCIKKSSKIILFFQKKIKKYIYFLMYDLLILSVISKNNIRR